MSKLKVSQMFYSFQGEGRYTGQLAVWLRLFGCNLKCPGFSQPNPADPSTYKQPISFDPKSIKTLDEFPVVNVGCDTLYAIDPRFKHLREDLTTEDVMKRVESFLYDGKWTHPKTKNKIHFCITGGEPLLQQRALSDLFIEMAYRNSIPDIIQFETNGTTKLDDSLAIDAPTKLHFNVSLKLFNVSGENYDWDSAVIASYLRNTDSVDLKVVVNSSDDAWEELDRKYQKLSNELGVDVPIFIMPVGATYDQQTNYDQIEKITRRAIDDGYHISGRLHVNTLGNAVDV